MPTFQEVIDARSIVTRDVLEVYNYMVDNKIYSEATIHSPIKAFVTSIDCIKFNFPQTLEAIDIGNPIVNAFEEEELPIVRNKLPIEFNMPNTNLLTMLLYNKNIINKDFMELFAPNIRYKYVYCSLNGTPLNIIITNLYMKYFTKKINVCNKVSYVNSPWVSEIYEYMSRAKQGKEFCKIIKEELVSVAFHPKRICPMIMKYGPEILDDL